MRTKPKIASVHLIPWDEDKDVYGIACKYDNGFISLERWGSCEQTILAVSVREQLIERSQRSALRRAAR